MRTVSFTQMKDGTREDYEFLREQEEPYLAGTAERILGELEKQGNETLSGYKISRLDHSLQSATRAEHDGADVDWIVSALLHDIGDGLAPQNHDRFAAEILRPFVREECAWVVEQHGIFQMYYYAHHYGWDREERRKFEGHQHYQACIDFCERWDQSSFDPDYETQNLEHFAPMVREVFSREAYDHDVLRPGESTGIPKSEG
ncbi:MAG: HD domain-containing protein [Hyphomicrobiales bacterium]